LIRKYEPVEREPLLEELSAKVERYKVEAMRYMRRDVDWVCCDCEQIVVPGESVTHRDLAKQLYRPAPYGDSSAISIAIRELVREGRIDERGDFRLVMK